MDTPILSRRDVEAFQPPGSPRTYHIAPLTVRERLRARAAVVAEGGIYPDQPTMFAAMREALNEAAPDNLDDLLGALDVAEADPANVDAQAKARRIETACQSSPAYTALLARRAQHMAAIPFVFFLHGVRGWEGPDLPPFERRGDVVREALLEAVPDAELQLVGWRAHALANPAKAAEGNLPGPSPSSETRKASRARNSPSTGRATSSPAKKSRPTRG